MATFDEMVAAAAPMREAIEKPQRPLFIVSINTTSIARGARWGTTRPGTSATRATRAPGCWRTTR